MISQQHCNITTSGVQYNYGKDIITLIASEAMILTVMNAILVLNYNIN